MDARAVARGCANGVLRPDIWQSTNSDHVPIESCVHTYDRVRRRPNTRHWIAGSSPWSAPQPLGPGQAPSTMVRGICHNMDKLTEAPFVRTKTTNSL